MAQGYAECSIKMMISYAQFLSHSHSCKHIYAALWPRFFSQKHLISITFSFQNDVQTCPNSIDSLRLLPILIFGTICCAA